MRLISVPKYRIKRRRIKLKMYIRFENSLFLCEIGKIVVVEKEQLRNIIFDSHEGAGESSHFKAMVSGLGRISTYEKGKACFFGTIYLIMFLHT